MLPSVRRAFSVDSAADGPAPPDDAFSSPRAIASRADRSPSATRPCTSAGGCCDCDGGGLEREPRASVVDGFLALLEEAAALLDAGDAAPRALRLDELPRLESDGSSW
eukprot:4691445-Prymnesium_polylepis.1